MVLSLLVWGACCGILRVRALFLGKPVFVLMLWYYRCHPCTGTAVCEATQWSELGNGCSRIAHFELCGPHTVSVWPTKAAVPLQWRGWVVIGVGAETKLKLMFFRLAELLSAPHVLIGQMDVHEFYLFVNAGQNPLKRFFSIGIVLMKHFKVFQFFYCLLLVSRLYEASLQHCHIAVTVSSTGICQMVGYFYLFDNTSTFFSYRGVKWKFFCSSAKQCDNRSP